MTLKRDGDMGTDLTSDTKVKFSVAQLCIICGALVAGTITVLSFVDKVRHDVEAARAEIGAQSGRLELIERGLKEQAQIVKETDQALQARLANWNPWRWKVTLDIANLGKKTGTEVWTRENDK